MKLYTCSNCRNPLYFENSMCLKCNHTIGFDSSKLTMLTLEPIVGTSLYYDIQNNENQYQLCANAPYGTCNWLVPKGHSSTFCTACDLNRTIPDIYLPDNLLRWKMIEIAKHRLVYSLLRLRLPIASKVEQPVTGIAFDFMADASPEEKVMIGHDSGIITINIEEADDAQRVRHQQELGEKYRTLLGHFRHEVGHYYWDVLIQNNPEALKKCRQLFGDDTIDYSEALARYYQTGAPVNWSSSYVSPYATAHAWEDWAETWAHYLHLMDTLETAYYYGVGIHPLLSRDKEMQADIEEDPYSVSDFDRVIRKWLPLTFAVNSLNRSMGYQDFYPFYTPLPVIEKLRFIHSLIGVGTGKL